MKLINQGRRAFIVKADKVIEGGELTIDKKDIYINPGDTVEVEEATGKALAAYGREIKVLSVAKEEEPKIKDAKKRKE